jgi:hypothetical protein
MASIHDHSDDNKLSNQYDNELPADISADENMVNAPPNEYKAHRRARKARNAKHKAQGESGSSRKVCKNLVERS